MGLLDDSATKRSTLVVGLEGAGLWLVGACGAPSARTPHIDTVAAGGEVLMNCFVDSLDLEVQLRSFWTGAHALVHASADRSGAADWRSTPPTIWQLARQAGVPTTLVTDREAVARLAEQAGCERAILVEAEAERGEPADDALACACMGVFQSAAELIAEGAEGLVWVHSRGLTLPWDAPIHLRQLMLDPDDPPAPEGVHPPGLVPEYRPRWLGETHGEGDYDPDWIVGWNQVALAQMSVLDEAVGLLRAAVAQQDQSQWNWLIHSFGQIPLGEHGSLGRPLEYPYLEHLRMVAILAGQQQPAPYHRQAIFQLPDLCAALRRWLGVRADPSGWSELPEEDQWERHWLAVATDRPQGAPAATWVRSPAWSLRMVGEKVQLFVQPDDRWEACDVADLEPAVVDALREAASAFQSAARSGCRDQFPPPVASLTNLLRT